MEHADNFDILKKAGEAIDEALAWHTVAIVTDGGKSIGTGSAILWGGRPLILTAGHVVESSPQDGIWFHFRPEGTLIRSPVEELHIRPDVKYTSKVRVEVLAKHLGRDVDLAALEVSLEIESNYPVRFYDLHQDATTPRARTPVALRGYPSDVAKKVAPGTLASFAVMECARLQVSPHLDGFDPLTEFLVKFSHADHGKHARGFSGAGAWFNYSTVGLWHPSLGLAGVCTSYFPRSKFLSIMRVECVTKFLRETFHS